MIHKGKVLERSGKYNIIDCPRCGFIHANPIPTIQELNEFYNKSFYQTTKPEYLEKTERELPYWQMLYQDKMDVLNKNIKKRSKRILDIGCSGGFFPKYFQDNGWEAVGIEPSPVAADYAKKLGVNVISKVFEEIDLRSIGKFDAIHLALVLEHVRDPIGICKKAYQMLNKGGIICIESPNDFNPLQAILTNKLNKEPYWVGLPDHINYFTPGSLQKMLQRNGFKITYMTGSFPMEFFVLMGEDYINNDKIGKACHQKRMSLELSLSENGLNAFKNKMYDLFIKNDIGRTMIIYGRK